MLKSMTAFGRAAKIFPWGALTIEMQSVNRRYLEIAFRLPSELQSFDMELRKWVQQHVHRGFISLTVKLSWNPNVQTSFKPNLEGATYLKSALTAISDRIGLPLTPEAYWSVAAKYEQLLFSEDLGHNEEEMRDALKETFDAALHSFIDMKLAEGRTVFDDLLARTSHISHEIEEIAGLSFNASETYRQKLIERLNQFAAFKEKEDERLLKEIALFAEKVDISEEITRFCHHLHRFGELLKESEVFERKSKGKIFDFLLQELNREINTIGAKASDYAISSRVVEIKGEIERIREQIQNVE